MNNNYKLNLTIGEVEANQFLFLTEFIENKNEKLVINY